MWATILSLAGPIIVFLIKTFVLSAAKKQEYIKSYYAFIDKVDDSGKTKAKNHLAAKTALEKLQEEIEKENQQ